jgi:hypothetical protein
MQAYDMIYMSSMCTVAMFQEERYLCIHGNGGGTIVFAKRVVHVGLGTQWQWAHPW